MPPHSQASSTVSALSEKPLTVGPVMRPHEPQIGLKGLHSGSTWRPVHSCRMRAMASRPFSAMTICGTIRPDLYIRSA